jgi:hypothetical protein
LAKIAVVLVEIDVTDCDIDFEDEVCSLGKMKMMVLPCPWWWACSWQRREIKGICIWLLLLEDEMKWKSVVVMEVCGGFVVVNWRLKMMNVGELKVVMVVEEFVRVVRVVEKVVGWWREKVVREEKAS